MEVKRECLASQGEISPHEGAVTEVRSFKKLRVSITEQCNLSCVYCDSAGRNAKKNPVEDNLESLLVIIQNLHKNLELESVRITGGEPTLNGNLVGFIKMLKQSGIPEVNLTTNGIMLLPLLEKLKSSGLDRINVSLDALDDLIFEKITGQPRSGQITKAIIQAQKLGFNVKINSIIMRGMNENQVLPLLEFALESGITIRYLELMKMGWAINSHQKFYYPQAEILEQIESRYTVQSMTREKGSTAVYFNIGRNGKFGMISNHSEPFCSDCNRLRLDHRGNLYGCISSPVYFPMVNRSIFDYPNVLENAMALKQKNKFTGSGIVMRKIGG